MLRGAQRPNLSGSIGLLLTHDLIKGDVVAYPFLDLRFLLHLDGGFKADHRAPGIGPNHLKGIVRIEPAVEEVAARFYLLTVPLLPGVQLKEPGISNGWTLLKYALQGIASRPQEEKLCPYCFSPLRLCPLRLGLGLLDGSHNMVLADGDS